MVTSESAEIIAAAKSPENENPNFFIHSDSVDTITADLVQDISRTDLQIETFNIPDIDYKAFISPTAATVDADVLIFKNVETSDAISAGLLAALTMTRLTGKDEWKNKTIVLIASDGEWKDPDLKDLFEELIEDGTVIRPLD